LAGVLLLGFRVAEAADPGPVTGLADLSFDELMQTKVATVYAASKHEESPRVAPSAITIITSADFKQFGYRTLADALRGARGFYVNYDRLYSYIGVRGVNRPGDFGGRVLITVNGHRLNEPVYDQAFSGTEFPLDVDLIDRVEIIRGSGSALYGNNAFFTIVNVITRRGADVNGGEVSGAIASYDTYSGRLSYGRRFASGADFLLSGTVLDSAGHERLEYPEFAAVNGGIAENLDGQTLKQAFGRLSYRDFSIEALYGDRNKDVPTAPYAGTVFNARPNEVIDERAFAELKWVHAFPGDWDTMARVYFDHYRFDGLLPLADPLNPAQTIVNQDVGLADWWGAEASVSKMVLDRHSLTLGAEYRQDLRLRQRNEDLDPPNVNNDVDTPGQTAGVYFQDQYTVRTNLTLTAGIRYDQFSTFGGAWSPRAGLVYSPWTVSTFKFLYGEAYRAPNAYEFDYVAPGYAANHDLEPERIRSCELVWEQDLSRRFKVTTSLFYNQIHDLISQEQDPVSGDYRFLNTTGVDVRGAEVELSGHWPGGLRGHVSYGFADAVDNASDSTLANSPRHLAKFGLVVPLYAEKLFAGLEVQATSSRHTVQASETDGFVVVNATLFSRELVPNLELSASLYNLFDARYADPAGPDFTQSAITQDGRSFRVKLTYRF
jgi:iron complex outermembrane receptor protein